jgi:hypothetical protein
MKKADARSAPAIGCPVVCVTIRSKVSFITVVLVIFVGWPWVSSMIARAETLAPQPAPRVTAPLAAERLFKTWNFDGERAGETPAGFAAHTVGAGPPGNWKIEPEQGSPSPPHRLTQGTACTAEDCLQILLAEELSYEYFDVTLRVRLAAGSQGGGGMVFAVKDQKNFYVAFANLEANTVEMIRMLDGKISVLGRAQVQPWKTPWHLLRVRRSTIISKEYTEVFFDGVQTLSIEDKALGIGQIGLATRGEAVMAFDNLNAAPLYSQEPLSPPAAY